MLPMVLSLSRTLVICEAFTGGRSCRNHRYLRQVILTSHTWILFPGSLDGFGQEILSAATNVTVHFITSVMVSSPSSLIRSVLIIWMMAGALPLQISMMMVILTIALLTGPLHASDC